MLTMFNGADPPASGPGPWVLRTALFMMLIAAASCETQPPTPGDQLTTDVSVREIMKEMTAPAADVLWSSVISVETPDGYEDRVPETDEGWANLRGSATAMVESANLLLIQGRHAAPEGTVTSASGYELEPYQVDSLIALDWEAWVGRVNQLQESGRRFLNTIDERDPDPLTLFDAGDDLVMACEGCHEAYWYPSN
jgi:hypothetical protein